MLLGGHLKHSAWKHLVEPVMDPHSHPLETSMDGCFPPSVASLVCCCTSLLIMKVLFMCSLKLLVVICSLSDSLSLTALKS